MGTNSCYRARLRRPPAELNSINEPFNPDKFNFNKIKAEEKIFNLIPKNHNIEDQSNNFVIVNVSPLEYGHVLLIPNPEKCNAQILTIDSLRLAVEFSLLNSNPFFRVAFNSLGAYASVNHLHFHGYYLKRQMFLETAPVEEIAYPCHRILNYPGKAFVFQIKNQEELACMVEKIFGLVKILQMKNVPHNLYITKGLDFVNSTLSNSDKSHRNCLRIFIWARKPNWGTKELSAFNIAVCELFGHMVIKNETDFNTLTEDYIVKTFRDITNKSYISVMPDIVKLFTQ